MTKSERLVFLINRLARGRVIHVEKTAVECDVTPRTIYRDIEALTGMNYPISYHNNGYRMDGNVQTVNRQLGQEDLDLLEYGLANNPLSDDPLFRDHFRVILQSVSTLRPDRNSQAQKLFVFEPSYRARSMSVRQHQHIGQFASAALQRRRINVSLRSGRQIKNCIPLIARFNSIATNLIIACLPDWERQEVRLDQVRRIDISRHKFRRRPTENIRAQRGE